MILRGTMRGWTEALRRESVHEHEHVHEHAHGYAPLRRTRPFGLAIGWRRRGPPSWVGRDRALSLVHVRALVRRARARARHVLVLVDSCSRRADLHRDLGVDTRIVR